MCCRTNLSLVNFSRLEISGSQTVPARSGDPPNYFFPASPIPTPKPRSSSSSGTTGFFCFPEKAPAKPKRSFMSRSFLGPLLRDILSLVGAQTHLQKPQYFTAFVLTDGEFCDVEESAQVF